MQGTERATDSMHPGPDHVIEDFFRFSIFGLGFFAVLKARDSILCQGPMQAFIDCDQCYRLAGNWQKILVRPESFRWVVLWIVCSMFIAMFGHISSCCCFAS